MVPSRDLYLTHIGLLALPRLSPSGVPQPPLEKRRNCWLKISGDRVVEIGPEGEKCPPYHQLCEALSAGDRLVTPGFVDAHTHPAFVRWRIKDFCQRIEGSSYHQIAERGGGILSTVESVRRVSEEGLTECVVRHFHYLLEFGVTAVEAKSGYGLTLEDELKSLRAIRRAAEQVGLTVSPTLLAAHTIPPEHRENPQEYIKLICEGMIPRVAEEGLAESVDVFLDRSAFTAEQAEAIFQEASRWNLRCRIHGDQFSSDGAARVALNARAITADHMDWTPPEFYEPLAQAGVVIVLLPGAVFFLNLNRYAQAGEMIRRGCRVALSTDLNPGSSPTANLPLMMTLACLKMGLTPEEALWAATMGGAYAIGRENLVGTLYPGYRADIAIWDEEEPEALPYRYGGIRPKMVLLGGKVVINNVQWHAEPSYA